MLFIKSNTPAIVIFAKLQPARPHRYTAARAIFVFEKIRLFLGRMALLKEVIYPLLAAGNIAALAERRIYLIFGNKLRNLINLDYLTSVFKPWQRQILKPALHLINIPIVKAHNSVVCLIRRQELGIFPDYSIPALRLA